MTYKKKNIVIDFKKNFKEKTEIIEVLKELINDNLSNDQKIEKLKKLKENWIKIGKVQSHLSFGLTNSYKHHVKLFYDYIYLNKKIKEKDQKENRKLKLEIINSAQRIESYGDKLKSYRELLSLIKKWNYVIGPIKKEDEIELDSKFDSIIQRVKENKKDYLKNKNDYDDKNLQIKKDLIEDFKKSMNKNVTEKNQWLKKIVEIEKIKDKFIGLGPIKSSLNNELWKEFKNLNKVFVKNKNFFFKDLKNTYSENIKKQLKIIDDCKKLKEQDEINIQNLKSLKDNFKKIKNVPYKRNKENWNLFLEEFDLCYAKVNNNKIKLTNEEKEKSIKKNELIEELKIDFSIDKLNQITEKWIEIGIEKKSNDYNKLFDVLIIELEKMKFSKSEIESHILKVKSRLMNNSERDFEKNKLRKKIEEINKQISQLENNLNFIKKGSKSSVLDGVYNDINKLRVQLDINQKKYILIR